MAEPMPSRASPSRWRRAGRALAALAGLALLAGLGAAGYGTLLLRRSLPRLEGSEPLPGLSAPVAVERDELGVPTIRGSTRLDVARATGFVHAQERFFQMDLLRRRAAGELSELVGAAALPVDRRTRVHRFRAVAGRALAAASPAGRALLDAYAAGVESGLRALAAPPFEYLVLRCAPAPWRPEDSLLVVLAMFIDLQGEDDAAESSRDALREAVPGPVFAFLTAAGGSWDAPLLGPPFELPPMPGPEVLDLRRQKRRPRPAAGEGGSAPGSNNLAVAGSHSLHGGAMVAGDMHLRHAVPNIWFRASLAWGAGEGARRVTGVTLPGVPALVAGSNGRVAWAFTNSYGDYQDLVVVEPAPDDPERYLAPGGPLPIQRVRETIGVKGAPAEELEVAETIWGPIIDKDFAGRRRALAWAAHRTGAVNLDLVGLETAGDVAAALAAAHRAGIPAQNVLAVDAAGHLGWTIAGRVPRRFGFDGRFPGSWADGTRGWDGWVPEALVPQLVDPPGGRLWTANARVVDRDGLAVLGDGGYALGARARQIRDDLLAAERFGEKDLLAIQLDDRAVFLGRWQRLLLDALDAGALAADPRRPEVRRLVEAWGGRAEPGSAGYRLVRAFRDAVHARVLGPYTAAARQLEPRFDPATLHQAEDAVWRIATERPGHLVDPTLVDGLLPEALDDALGGLPGAGADLAERSWGERNTAAIRHPLSRAIPVLGGWLDMPAEPLRGDANMPRVAGPSFGASQRMVVSPGHEEQGIFHMPGGQSGHPLSPFYRAGHAAWVRGDPTPFLPGPVRYRLRLEPPGG